MNYHQQREQKQLKERIKKTFQEKKRSAKRKQRVESGFYSKINTFFLIGIIIILGINFKLLNAQIDTFIQKGSNPPKASEKLTTGQLEANNEVLEARVTCYSWTGNKMANGEFPKEGDLATSDRSIPFGTKVIIDGKEYEVGDRTALWVHDKFDLPTFDIYLDDCSLEFGAKKLDVIIKNQ